MIWRVEHGKCEVVMAAMPEASVDAIVCDPPYGLEFMGKGWDGADGFRRSLNAADVGRDTPHGRASRTSPEYRAGRLFGEWCELWGRWVCALGHEMVSSDWLGDDCPQRDREDGSYCGAPMNRCAEDNSLELVEARCDVETVERLRQSYGDEGNRLSNIARWTDDTGAEGVVIDGHLSVFAKPSMTHGDGVVAVGIDLPWLANLQGAVAAARAEQREATIRHAAEFLDTLGRGDLARALTRALGGSSAPAEDTTLNVLARVIENRHGTLPGIGVTLREALAELKRGSS